MKKQADKIRRVGLLANSGKVSCAGIVRRAARLVTEAGRRVIPEAQTAEFAGLKTRVCEDALSLAREVDLLLVFGGDGTMLRVAREIAGSHTPVLGVNIGSLGFLTAVPSADLGPALRQVWRGQFIYESRTLLQARADCFPGPRAGGSPQDPARSTLVGRLVPVRRTRDRLDCRALNDIVIGRGMSSRLIELEVAVDGDVLTRYRCDGLIVSSPTGSTAYSLAAGGAVVYPTAEVLELTPICPHTLSNRSLIVPLSSVITIKVISPRPETILSADGQVVSELAAGDTITVRRSRSTVRLMHLAGSSFGETLRRKLHWRGTPLAHP